MLGIARYPDALAAAVPRLARFGGGAAVLVQGNFWDIAEICEAHNFVPVDGVMFDLGFSSLQLETPGRGFSFQRDEPLDMRMDRTAGETAADLVARSTEHELADAIFAYGEERFSRRIARAIVAGRSEAPIVTTGRL